jgi:hypothetical protein
VVAVAALRTDAAPGHVVAVTALMRAYTSCQAREVNPAAEGGDVAMRRHGIDLNPVAIASGMVERCR